jgi:Bifunctional DNA primase/polymerase, N-terminal
MFDYSASIVEAFESQIAARDLQERTVVNEKPGPVQEAPMLAAALSWAEDGWCIFPADISLDEETGKFKKKSHKSAEYSGGAKWGKTRDPEQVRRDFQRWPEANIGVPTGKDNDIFVVEADTPKGHNIDGVNSLRRLEEKHGPLPPTLMAESPSGSLHYYFNWPKGVEIKNSASVIGPGIDVRGEGGMVIGPPSVRSDGCYRWLNDDDIADAPQWLLDLVTTSRSDGKDAQQPPRLKIA